MKETDIARCWPSACEQPQCWPQSAWTGGDDLPTNPLACDGTPAAAAAKPMTAALPTNPPDRKGKKITVVDVPKLIGIGYFNATSKGIADAAAELGNVTPRPTARPRPTSTSRSPSSTTTSPPASTAFSSPPTTRWPSRPVLKKALEKGINVVGYDANSTPDARQWFVNQAQFNGIAKALVDSMAAEIGEEAPSPSSPRPSPRRTRRAGSPRWRPMPRSATPR
jgi:rhamnose transport system substrate-binding protein